MVVRQTARDKLAELARKGLTQSEAARQLRVSRQRVSQLTAVLGLNFKPSYPPVPEPRLKELAKKGMTQTEAAQRLGVSQKRVSSLAARHGVTFAPVWSRPRSPKTELGRVLQSARLAAGHSYAKLAELSGLHRRHIAAIEVGQVRRPTEKTLRVLANCLKGRASYNDLFRAAFGGDSKSGRAAPRSAQASAEWARRGRPARGKPARRKR